MGDKKIKCIDCYKDFIFTAGEQEFFEEKGYSEPIRCKDCRERLKKEPAASVDTVLYRFCFY
jgi:hypothetical protein